MIEKHRVDAVNEIIEFVDKYHFDEPPIHMMTDSEVEDLYMELLGEKIRIVNR